MLKVLASVVAAGAIALAASGAGAQSAPKATPAPFVIGTLEPFGATSAPLASPLPNIGRTRSVTPACAVMRDLIVPSWTAALKADERFTETRKRLPNYAEIADDPEHQNDVYRQALIARLDSDVSTMFQQTQVISKALGDPRLSPDSKDPQVLAERRQLQQLYEAQQIRANLLNEFVMRERVATAKHGLEDTGAFKSRISTNYNQTYASQAPIPALTAPPGMPLRNGIALADKNALTDWGSELHNYVHQSENQAAKTFLPIAKSCTGATPAR